MRRRSLSVGVFHPSPAKVVRISYSSQFLDNSNDDNSNDDDDNDDNDDDDDTMMTMFPQIFFPEANRELQYLHLIAAPSNSRSLRRSLASGMEADDVPPARAPAAPASPPPRAEARTPPPRAEQRIYVVEVCEDSMVLKVCG